MFRSKILLIYNSAGQFMMPQLNVGSSGLTAVAGLTRDAGLQLLSYYQANPSATISFPSGPLVPASQNAPVGTIDKFFGGIVTYVQNISPM